MMENFRSGLLAGLISAVIWMTITSLVGSYSKGAIVGGGWGFLVVVAVITMVISTIVGRSKRAG